MDLFKIHLSLYSEKQKNIVRERSEGAKHPNEATERSIIGGCMRRGRSPRSVQTLLLLGEVLRGTSL